jgi:Zn-dependent protease
MKWSWHIGKIAGIDLKIHLTFIFLLVWVGFSAFLSGGDLAAAAGDILFILALFLCVVLHELGHALMAKRFDVETEDITLLPIGGVARLARMPEEPKEEFLVAAAGPAVNLVIGFLLLGGMLVSGFFNQPLFADLLVSNFWMRLLTANFTLVLFNLIPAFPMDGGRVLRALLASRMPYVRATRTAANVGRVFAVLMGIAGFFINPWLVLTALFVWSGAGAEARSVALKAGVKGLTVRDAMISKFYQVEANQSLGSVFQLSMATGQNNIPVMSNGHFLGLIRREDLLNALNRLGDRAPAYAAIGVEPEGLDPDAPLGTALEKFAISRILPVIEDRALIGLVTPESVQQRLWLQQRPGGMDNQRPPEESIPRA